AKTNTAENLLPAGWIIASEQLKLPLEKPKPQFDITKTGKITYKEGNTIDISGNGFSIVIDSKTGIIISYKCNSDELLVNGMGPRPVFWRAPTDNDYGWRMPKVARLWKKASEQQLLAASIKASQFENFVRVEVIYQLDSLESTWKTEYTILGNGIVKVENMLVTTNENIPVIPRLGMKMHLPQNFSQIEYLGRGPWENYSDRNSSTFVGRYKTTVSDMYVPYIRPQENGHRTDVRWFSLTNADGKGLLVVADQLIEFNALHYTVDDLDAGPNKDINLLHANDIKPRDLVELHIDYRMIGVGGDDSWGAWPHEPYLIRPSTIGINYGFILVPVSSLNEAEEMCNYKY
ncbi:MAG: glycoside hydrolase family 2, partial [Bacteroidales bacterium]|nr:glycoside hydrolase family 2 [Bacteroidales bacterium]